MTPLLKRILCRIIVACPSYSWPLLSRIVRSLLKGFRDA
jgi:hypothetical protein